MIHSLLQVEKSCFLKDDHACRLQFGVMDEVSIQCNQCCLADVDKFVFPLHLAEACAIMFVIVVILPKTNEKESGMRAGRAYIIVLLLF